MHGCTAMLDIRYPSKSSKAITAEVDNQISTRTVRRRLCDIKLLLRIARKFYRLEKKFAEEETIRTNSQVVPWAIRYQKMA